LRKILARGVLWALAALLFGALPSPAQPSYNSRAEVLENGAYSGTLLTRIREAKRRIICAFYLFKVSDGRRNLPAAVARELIGARLRGVAVTVILDPGTSINLENRRAASMLLQNGVSVRFPSRRRVTHAKAMVIDDRYVLIGSHNLTQSALTHNNELSVLLDSPQLAAEVTRYLEDIR
jgi:phosphatidylserine/phosphatidylglycerophosphate/cardiolipin synthase-like enzyme